MTGVSAWEENTERRIGILEAKMDKLLDPEHGIYPVIMRSQARLQNWAIGILTGIVLALLLLVANIVVALVQGRGGVVDEGGGASRSTDPAAGSSAATDVSLREYTGRDLWWLDRHLTAEVAALRRETIAAQRSAGEAIEVAKEEAKERLLAHNGLIEQMRQQATLFASREALEDFKIERHQALDAFKDEADKRFGRIERFQAMLIGGMLLISFIGIANLVKVWSG